MTASRRYRRILVFFWSVTLQLVVWEWLLPRVGFGGAAERSRSARLARIAARFRALAIEMGGVLIKVGQFLSSRVDVLPEEITSGLTSLQDEVPPEPFARIREVIVGELGPGPFGELTHIDEAPLAAASLGQVHRATLDAAAAGEGPVRVVIKVQRPDIEVIIATDLAALGAVGRWLNHWPPIRRRADIPSLLTEFTRVLYEELDYLAEGRNAETFAANLARDPGVAVPRVVWRHTTRHVLTLEDVFAIKISDHDALTAAGVDRAEVARRLFQVYLQQIVHDGFFHADPHPGNLFVAPQPDGGWRLVFVDFGMVGRLPAATRAGLREAAVAVATRDSTRLVRAQQQLGLLLPTADLAMLERAERQILERLWGRTMAELQRIGRQEARALANEFRELLYTMPFHVPEDLILLGRTVGILSGMCTALNPQFNAWHELTPFARTLVEEDGAAGWSVIVDELWDLAAALLTVPKRADAVLGMLERGEVSLQIPNVERELARLELTIRRTVGIVVAAVAALGAVQFHFDGHATTSAWLAGAAAAALLWSATRRR
jgi:predicted unusual protein kinase regulating ubiquinone biosynthesis (AarF/ABC1/UbiB family)